MSSNLEGQKWHSTINSRDLINILESGTKEGHQILIIAEDIDHEALATLLVIVNFVVVFPPRGQGWFRGLGNVMNIA